MIRTILHYPDKRLREVARKVEAVTPEILRLIDDMAETMYAAPGVGLAANQVGIGRAFFVYDDREGHAGFVANPELSEPQGQDTIEEGCLSIPGPYHETTRAVRVRLRGQDVNGDPVDIRAEGLLARIFQHETDHLRGMLYIDRLDDEGRRDVMRQLREFEVQRSEG